MQSDFEDAIDFFLNYNLLDNLNLCKLCESFSPWQYFVGNKLLTGIKVNEFMKRSMSMTF